MKIQKKHYKFKFIDLFSGIGGFRIGIDKNGGESVGYSEIDKKAVETYKNNFDDPDNHDLGDVTRISELEYVDMVVGGVPCQSWSVAGKKRGFDDPRGRLWHDAIRIVELTKPKVFIFENVKGLYDPRNRDNLQLIIDSLEEVGYTVHFQLLNSYDFGVPQNRTRIYIVGFRNDLKNFSDQFSYPKPIKKHGNLLNDFLDGIEKKDHKKTKFDPVLIHGDSIPKARNAFQLEDELNDFFIFCDTRNGHSTVHSWELYDTTTREKEICMTILKNRRKKIYGPGDGNPLGLNDLKSLIPNLKKAELVELLNKRILRISQYDKAKYEFLNSKNSSGIDGIYRVYLPNSHIFSTLTATGTKDYVATDYVVCDDPSTYKACFVEQIVRKNKLRQVSPREAARIQGFPDDFKYHDKETYAHKQFGNAVSPPVVESLTKAIVKTGVFSKGKN